MELRHLEYFIQVCNNGSFTKAAEVLGISQPTLSQQIRVLEGEIDTPLFHRVGRGIKITEAGKLLLDKGKFIMQLFDEVHNEIFELKGVKRGVITIGGLLEDLTYLTPYIMQFQQHYPNILVKIIESEVTVNQIVENNIDIGITRSFQTPDTLTSTFLYSEELVLVIPKNHPLNKKSFVSFRELVGLSRIMTSSSCRESIKIYCENLGLSLSVANIETKSSISLLSLVCNGHGVAIIPLSLVDFVNNDSLSIVRIVDPTPSQDINLIHFDDKFLSFAARIFMQKLNDLEKVSV
ncbi:MULTISPECIES: LysR family transcriptional regulator [unclassified Bacillus (in: firmicutes)]|uniref:LysR family transcriptional regulator n=1 Tax=unclassified Bacillus (in: firmicutes) TaxID=185979 RepID=UPI0008E0615A|nr:MULTISPECIES: LysR family transcriptional regulator [unclassified Bacillus (in: firmicutes)]SFI40943.1 DNA-binding transcriptional regulator, LysR family [Bacillus sp. 71mf]SFT10547.1 DNA-binding transcriptional regulator, LysR family [Bacillus sp. 103mf]